MRTAGLLMGDVDSLLKSVSEHPVIESERLFFKGVENKDVYNPSKEFLINGEEFLFGRVEPRDNSELSKVFLFKKEGNSWIPDKKFNPIINSEDPFTSKINDDFILGCVEVVKMKKEHESDPDKLNYRNVFYRGKNPW